LPRPGSARYLIDNNKAPCNNLPGNNAYQQKQMPQPIVVKQQIQNNYKPQVGPSSNNRPVSSINRPGSRPDSAKPGAIVKNPMVKQPSPNNAPVKKVIDNRHYKYESPYNNAKAMPQYVQQPKINRPISSKVDQKIVNAGLKKMPEPRMIGNQIKISEKLVKNNNAKNYGNNNFLRNNKQEPVRAGAGHNMGPRIVNYKK